MFVAKEAVHHQAETERCQNDKECLLPPSQFFLALQFQKNHQEQKEVNHHSGHLVIGQAQDISP